jgi:hypothetical protein
MIRYYKTIILFLLYSTLSHAQLYQNEKFSLGFEAGGGFFNGAKYGPTDPRNFPVGNFYDLHVSNAKISIISFNLKHYINQRYYFESRLNIQKQEYGYSKNEPSNLVYRLKESYINRKENKISLSGLYGIKFQGTKSIHHFGIGPSVQFFENIQSEQQQILYPLISNSASSTIKTSDYQYRLTSVFYLTLKTTHGLKFKKHIFTLSPQFDLLLFQPYKNDLTHKTRGAFIFQIGYVPPLFKIPTKNDFNEIVDAEIDEQLTTANDSTKDNKKNYFIFFSSQIGGPGLYYLLNSEIRFIQSKYLRANFSLGYSTLIYENNGINAIVPGLKFSLIRKKWKTEFGVGLISMTNKYGAKDNSITFQIARFIEFGKGYSFKFGLASFQTGYNYGGSTPILAWPFISIGKCYQLSDL